MFVRDKLAYGIVAYSAAVAAVYYMTYQSCHCILHVTSCALSLHDVIPSALDPFLSVLPFKGVYEES